MWSNREGQIFVIPRHRAPFILKGLGANLRQLAARCTAAGGVAGVRHALHAILSRARRSGWVAHAGGRRFPVFESKVGADLYRFIGARTRDGRFALWSARVFENFGAEPFDSRQTGRNLRDLDRHLLSTIPGSHRNWQSVILDNQGQSAIIPDAHGWVQLDPNTPRGSTVDRAYVGHVNGRRERVNVELDGDRRQFRAHIGERIRADKTANHYFILQDHLTGKLIGAAHWNPHADGGRGALTQIDPRRFAGRGKDRFGFLPKVAARRDAGGALRSDPGYRRPRNKTAPVTPRNFGNELKAVAARNKKLIPRVATVKPSRRARESEWMFEALPPVVLNGAFPPNEMQELP